MAWCNHTPVQRNSCGICRCKHNEPNFNCDLCKKAYANPKWRKHWGITEADTSVELITPSSTECIYYGREITGFERQELKLDHIRDWHECTHPLHPADTKNSPDKTGQYVCECVNCGETKCTGYTPPKDPMRRLNWAYGVTTFVTRLETTLPVTLESLKGAGFDNPHLFIDGVPERKLPLWIRDAYRDNYTVRYPRIGIVGNWLLGMWELSIRHPHCDLYALFQDDLLICNNVRQYIDEYDIKPNTYLNMYCRPENDMIKPSNNGKYVGWYKSNQRGKGALALVMPGVALEALLTSKGVAIKARAGKNPTRNLDGMISDALRSARIVELVHSPSLVDHTGDVSTHNNGKQPHGVGFPGDGFDASMYLGKQTII